MSPQEFKEWRFSHRLSIAQVAKLMQLDKNTICRFENGENINEQTQYIIDHCADYYAD
jgi:transcriptional regulator with XRE-family HTH domain